MFPNVRLMIVAMLASLTAICCCFGVFAAFRVNHEPFTRSQSSNPPLQLVFGNGAPAAVTDAAVAPFGVRFALAAPLDAKLAVDGTDAGPITNPGNKEDKAAAVAAETPPDQSVPAIPAAADIKVVPASATAADAALAAKAAHPMPRRRIAKVRRLHRSQAANVAPPLQQFPDWSQSTFPAAPQAAAPMLKHHTAAKRHRAAKNTADMPVARQSVAGRSSGITISR
jgi:hypothetical protein